MTHQMQLNSAPFQAIRSGQKCIEMRLYDEKRRKIQTGDSIVFTDIQSGETLVCQVIKLHVYPTFDELYAHHDKIAIGYKPSETASPKDMLAYYPQEKIERYGVVGIEIRLGEQA